MTDTTKPDELMHAIESGEVTDVIKQAEKITPTDKHLYAAQTALDEVPGIAKRFSNQDTIRNFLIISSSTPTAEVDKFIQKISEEVQSGSRDKAILQEVIDLASKRENTHINSRKLENPDELTEAINDRNSELVKTLVTREGNPIKVEAHHIVQADENFYSLAKVARFLSKEVNIKDTLVANVPTLQVIEDAKEQFASKQQEKLSSAINNTDINTVKTLLGDDTKITEKHLQAAVSNYAKFDIDKSDKIDDQRKMLRILIEKSDHKTIENANLPAFTLGNQIIANEIATMIADKEPPTRAKTVLTLVSPSNQQMRK